MQTRFKLHIDQTFPELKNQRLLLAISGGIDSMVLLHLCLQANLNVTVAHCNFHLRGNDSDEDQRFVVQSCQDLKVPCFSTEFQTETYATTHKKSIQIAARELRYSWFDQLIDEHGYEYLLTAHHLDDAIETFLINFSRGTGLDGLLGIPERNGQIRRPLLPFSRQEIESYAKEHQILWREDYTNAQTKYLRNKLRKDVVPIFKEYNANFEQSFQNTISYLKEADELAADAAAIYFEEVAKNVDTTTYFSIGKLKQIPHFNSYLRYWLKPYGFKAWADIEKLIDAKSGKMIFSEHYVLLKNRESLILELKQVLEPVETEYFINENQELTKPLTITIENYDQKELPQSPLEILVDKDTVQFPLKIRKWKEGDYFYPLGMGGKKKLSKYFKDEKYSQIDKEATWLLCSEDEIVWIIGGRMDDRFKIRNTTTNFLKIKLNP